MTTAKHRLWTKKKSMKNPAIRKDGGFMVQGSGFEVYCPLIGMKASYEWE